MKVMQQKGLCRLHSSCSGLVLLCDLFATILEALFTVAEPFPVPLSKDCGQGKHPQVKRLSLLWPGAHVRALYSAWSWDVSSVKFCNSLLKGKGPRLRRCWGRMEGWYIIFFIWGWCADCLTLVTGRSRTSLFRAENKMWVVKMCIVNTTTGLSLLQRTLSSRVSSFLRCARQIECSLPLL